MKKTLFVLVGMVILFVMMMPVQAQITVDEENYVEVGKGIKFPDGSIQTQANPDPPCFHNYDRYVDCGNGTVHDTMTNLIWLKNANCSGGLLQWAAANEYAAGLGEGDCGLTDGSSPGDWRLPTKEEWEATFEQANMVACSDPSLMNTPGTDCYENGPQPFTDVELYYYWSSTTYANYPTEACFAHLSGGNVGYNYKTSSYRVWPVRRGQ